MQISWNGLGSFTISGKPTQGEVKLITDPYQSSLGLKLSRVLSADLVVSSHDGEMANNIAAIASPDNKKQFHIHHAGEYEVSGIFVTGIEAKLANGDQHTIYKFELEDIAVGFLGAIDRELTDKELELLGAVDILLLPVGGERVLNAKSAALLVAKIEPRIVVPSYFYTDGLKIKLDPANAFIKEVGAPVEEVNKIKISRSGLPQEEMKIMLLSRS
ncbi:hypothetical protein D6827_02975 [Candidatus Parcubacteria bacterium]|nr:MAG: hypothetical protein D6827_02975 [Candidatus Parcubacteria bacterium]